MDAASRNLPKNAAVSAATMLRILLIEADTNLCNEMRSTLSARNHQVVATADAAEGLYLAARGTWDVLVVASQLRYLDGITIISTLRQHGDESSILILSDETEVERRVEALEMGADDCLVRPFSMIEMNARVEALGRRRRPHDRAVIKVGDMELNTMTRSVRHKDRPIELQQKEFQLLEFLMRHAGQIVTREMLLKGVWGYQFDPRTNIIETHVSRLRSRIDSGFGHDIIQTIRGIGYCLRASETRG